MTTTKIARFIAIAVLSGTVMPAGAYQMPVVGPDSDPLVATSAPSRLTQPAPIPHTTRARTPATYGPTHNNETLWSIASRVRPSKQVSVQQTIGALYRLNPSAFENNNLHGLQPGSRLRIPTLAQVRAERTSVINSRLEREKPLWEAYTRNQNQPQQAVKTEPNTAVPTNTAVSPKALISAVTAPAAAPTVTTPAITADKPAGNLADRYQQANTGALTTGTATAAASTTEKNTTTPEATSPEVSASEASAAKTSVPELQPSKVPSSEMQSSLAVEQTQTSADVQTPNNTAADKKTVGQGSASAVIPLTVAASMATRILENPSDSPAASGNTITSSEQNTQPDSAASSPEEQLKHLRQRLVESNTEITLLAEKNLRLNNQVSALSIEMKSLQATLAEEQHFRQDAATQLTQADLQAKQLAELQVKYDMLESSSASLTHQMAKSWPVAIAVGVIPPTIIGFLLWVLYRVRQRKQQDMLSQAFEEHQSKNMLHPDSVNLLAEETPDLNRSDDLLIDPDWNAITASELNEPNSPDASTTTTDKPSADTYVESGVESQSNSGTETHTVLLDDTFSVSVPDLELTKADAQTLPEPPSLFAGLDESIYSPSSSLLDTDLLSSETAELSEARLASAKANKLNGESESASFPESAVAPAMLAPKVQDSAAEQQANRESQELASLVDNDLAHGDMLGGEQNLELGDDIVDVMLSTPTRQHGSPLDLDDDVHLLADIDDDTDSVLLLSDEELFESAQPLQPESVSPTAQSASDALPASISDTLPDYQSDTLPESRPEAVPAPVQVPAATKTADFVEAQTHLHATAESNINITETETNTETAAKTEVDTAPTLVINEPAAASPAKTPLFDLPDMTEADFDLSTPLLSQAEHWSMPLPPEPQSEHEDWEAQPHLMTDQLSPEERDGVTQPSFVRALHPRQPAAESANSDDDMTDDLVGKLILARAYLDIDDPEGAVALLNEVIAQGSESQQQQAKKMLQEATPV